MTTETTSPVNTRSDPATRACEPSTICQACDADERPRIVIEPCMLFGQPHLDGHRLTPEQLASYVWEDHADEIWSGWPNLTHAQIVVACWYQATYGGRTWRKRWQVWADEVFARLWHQNFDSVPLPPSRAVARETQS